MIFMSSPHFEVELDRLISWGKLHPSNIGNLQSLEEIQIAINDFEAEQQATFLQNRIDKDGVPNVSPKPYAFVLVQCRETSKANHLQLFAPVGVFELHTPPYDALLAQRAEAAEQLRRGLEEQRQLTVEREEKRQLLRELQIKQAEFDQMARKADDRNPDASDDIIDSLNLEELRGFISVAQSVRPVDQN
jgi:hypothetical protein